MLGMHKFASKAAATALAVVCASSALVGVAATTTASAAPTKTVKFTHCHLKHGANYPPGKCYLRFNKSKYHRGDNVVMKSSKAFKPHEALKLVEKCKKYKYVPARHHGKTWHHTGPLARARGHFHVKKKNPYGKCTVTITGKTTGDQVRGTFRVVKKKHHH